jgi:hypothetical protein
VHVVPLSEEDHVTTSSVAAGVLLTAAGLLTSSCSSDPTGPEYNPEIPATWTTAITNQFYPLIPGTTYQYAGETPEGTETITIEVLDRTRTINGVVATVVSDRAFLNGELIEDTEDWFAQDQAGNVWYLGEDTKEYEDGQVVSTDGSWEWGIDGALPGIIMWADPAAHVGEEYRQEFYPGEAEDLAKVIATDQSVSVTRGNFTGCISALEPGILEHKTYCPEVGLVLEEKVQGDEGRVELTDITR